MLDLDKLIQSAKADIAELPTATQEVVIGGEIVNLQFTKLEPMKWRNLTASFMPRDGSMRDIRLGYNYDALPSGFPVSNIKIIDGDELVEITESQWGDVYAILESPDIFNVATALWGLHEWEPEQKANTAKKALARVKSGNSRKR